ncbi:FAD-binding oxidoreductase [Glaciihabitans arcticus]|uniref:FAD-binding oxidoreductase n=1 Tax=Glaciihabitans arcticus TaxID=2668039 RepID=A0A4Q9GX89_9MICO|nr:FAD-binding oxidoreductase [Glaciihabitans arcticus]TBN58218.1 FAD-binding oxidoreductase [Glaciihabitans arcticus]
MTDFAPLIASVSGPVLTPADGGYAEELSGFHLGLVHSPEAVIGAVNASDVVAAVGFARDRGLPVRVIATGHGAEDPITDGIVITTRRLDAVSVDAESRLAVVGGGARWAAVVSAAAEHGLAVVPGSSTNVGVVGYLMGGGLGPIARSHGFSSDRVRGFSVVTGSGELVEASATENPDLFWALRGGKGGLGVVTEVRVELVPLELYAGSLLFATDQIEPALRAWVDYAAIAPDDVTTSVAIMRFPPIAEIPEMLRGKTLLSLRFAFPGTEQDGTAHAAPLRNAAPALVDTIAPLAPADMATIHGDPTDPAPSWTSGGMLSAVDQDFASALLAQAGASAELPFVAVEVRHVGGATRADVPEGSAVGGRASSFTFGLVGILAFPGALEAMTGAAAGLREALAPWISDESTINFMSGPRDAEQFASAWPAETFARLKAVRAQYDPDGIFPFGLN